METGASSIRKVLRKSMKSQLLIFICLMSTAYGELQNVALCKPTAISSEYFMYNDSSKAVDGNKQNDISECFHTLNRAGEREWFRVDLQDTFEVHSVNILNRGDCCGYRLSNFKVLVTNEIYSHPDASPDSTVCIHHIAELPHVNMTHLSCTHPLEGRFVYVVFMHEQFMHFCEIEVMAEIPALQNVALGKPATISSSYIRFNTPENAVDGDLHTDMPHCFHVGLQWYPWFRVDLLDQYTVFSVKITNRGDRWGIRLRNFTIVVTDQPSDAPQSSPPNTMCQYHEDPVPNGATVDLECQEPLVGRYVTVVMMLSEYLHFCEIEVMARPAMVDLPCAAAEERRFKRMWALDHAHT